jgi:hypothetical protein
MAKSGMACLIARAVQTGRARISLSLIRATDPSSVEELIVETRKTYGGPLEVAEDLMQFEIGEDVKVRRYDLQHAI